MIASHSILESESGQSLMEFAMMLPILVGMTVMFIRINTAIQISHVNQQYARGEALYLAFNSPFYPELKTQRAQAELKLNQMVLGVSQNLSNGEGQKYTPEATVQIVTRSKTVRGNNAPKEQPDSRAQVRVRNTVTLCSQNYYYYGSGAPARMLAPDLKSISKNNLANNTRFDYCRSPYEYE